MKTTAINMSLDNILNELTSKFRKEACLKISPQLYSHINTVLFSALTSQVHGSLYLPIRLYVAKKISHEHNQN